MARGGARPRGGVKAPTLPLRRRVRAPAREAARKIKGRGRRTRSKRWSIDRLIPYAKNARTHSDAQIAAIAASIKEWGWTTPALVGEDGGLIAGHARILAARQRRVRLSATIRTSPGGPRTATTSPLPSLYPTAPGTAWSVPSPPGGARGDRWRGTGAVRDGEVDMRGGRVRADAGGQAVVMAWSERIRYGAKGAGYHGGASPQEVVVPIAVLSANEVPRERGLPTHGALRDWVEAPPAEPPWWRDDEPPLAAVSVVAPQSPPESRRRATPQPDLFSVPPPDRSAWVNQLFTSPTYEAQRRLAGRGAPGDDSLRLVLLALDARGDGRRGERSRKRSECRPCALAASSVRRGASSTSTRLRSSRLSRRATRSCSTRVCCATSSSWASSRDGAASACRDPRRAPARHRAA
jgi:hypothetical protein